MPLFRFNLGHFNENALKKFRDINKRGTFQSAPKKY
jgi:hypothetical protein